MKKRLAIITTHPIQYNAPLYALLAKRGIIDIRVFYTWGEAVLEKKYDPGFNKTVSWDIPLLEGYDHCFVKNVATAPGSHHFRGIDNPSLVKDVEAWNADAILVYGWAFKSHLHTIRYFSGKIPVLFRGDSTLLGKNNFIKKKLRTIFLKWVYRNIDFALYVGTHNKNYFIKHGLTEKQLVFVPHAVDNDRFSALIEDGESINNIKAGLHIPEGQILFLFAAKLDQNKNAELLIDSFNSLKSNEAHLVIAGSGSQESILKEAGKDNKRIHFLPFQNQSNMPLLYKMGDVFILPSRSETWGLAINEAMACSRAVLASDSCGASVDLIKNGVNGFIFKSENAADLADKLKECILHKDQIKEWGKNAFRLIENWNYENGCKTIEWLMNEKNIA